MWTVGRRIEEEEYNFADALAVGCMVNTLINNADTVKIACLAQLVNALSAIMTEPGGGAWAQTIYYPFALASQNGRGTALKPDVKCDTYSCAINDSVPYIDVSAVCSADCKTVTVFAVNRSSDEDIECDICVAEGATLVSHTALRGFALDAVNTETASPVIPKDVPVSGKLTLSAASWNMLKFEVNK